MPHFRMLLSTACLVAMPLSASAQDVVIPDPNYASGRATAFAVKAIIEEALGLKVGMITTTAVPVIFEAMAKGTGEIDVWTETWLPNQSAPVQKYAIDEQKVIIGKPFFEAKQGYCATTATVTEHGIKSVFDLANPENAKLFDTNGDGKGEIWIGGQGWQSTNTEQIRARDYGFADFFELQAVDEAIATAGLAEAVKANRPWVGYCYSPHQNFAMYDLTFLDEPPYDPEQFKMVQPAEDPDWMAKSHVASAYAPTTVHNSWSASLAERQPALVPLLENIQLSADDVNVWAKAIVDGADPEALTHDWVKAHPELIAKWMSQ